MNRHQRMPAKWVKKFCFGFKGFFCYVKMVVQIRHEREQLSQLDDRKLLDIGIDRISANLESNRELLDLPANRLHQSERTKSAQLAMIDQEYRSLLIKKM